MFIKVETASYLGDYKLELHFSDGSHGVIDLKQELWGEIFEPLKKIDLFKKFYIKNGTIEWPNGADMAPEFLHQEAMKNKIETVED